MNIPHNLEKNFTFKQIRTLGIKQSREFVMVFLAKNLALTGVRGVKVVNPYTSLPLLRGS